MKKRLHFWPEGSALCILICILIWTRSLLAAVIIALIVLVLIHGYVHVPDNSACAMFLLDNYLTSVGPGHHFVLWPIIKWGDSIDTRYVQARCDLDEASSDDRVIFSISLLFSYRFVPQRIRDRQKAHEFISFGEKGRSLFAKEIARNSALYIVRRFTHLQIMTGTQQALIQGQIAQETAQRLAPLGMDLLTTSFRATFQGPQELNEAYVQQQAARPTAQSMITHMTELVMELKRYGTPELQHYIDLLMVRVMNNRNTEPLSALLAREWFHRSRGNSGNIP